MSTRGREGWEPVASLVAFPRTVSTLCKEALRSILWIHDHAIDGAHVVVGSLEMYIARELKPVWIAVRSETTPIGVGAGPPRRRRMDGEGYELAA